MTSRRQLGTRTSCSFANSKPKNSRISRCRSSATSTPPRAKCACGIEFDGTLFDRRRADVDRVRCLTAADVEDEPGKDVEPVARNAGSTPRSKRLRASLARPSFWPVCAMRSGVKKAISSITSVVPSLTPECSPPMMPPMSCTSRSSAMTVIVGSSVYSFSLSASTFSPSRAGRATSARSSLAMS